MVVPSYILFLCYVHSSSCCIDNTSFVATTTSTTINLFTPTSLHVVAPHCPSPTLLSVEAADDGVNSDFQQTIYTVSVTDLSVVVPSCILFICYVHSSSCCIDKTSFVATSTATTINLFTPKSLDVVAPNCAAPNTVLC